jgi:hypothetical protein
MKILMIYCRRFGYKTSQKGLDSAPDLDSAETVENALVGFIGVEAEDEADPGYVETKLVKNMKWAARKNETSRVVLHSFTHLSESKADPEVTKSIFDSAEERLAAADYTVSQTPFGWFLDLHIDAPGNPLTRLFKDIVPKG